MEVVYELIDKKILRIIVILLKNKDRLYHLKQLSYEANVPIATTYRIVKKLVNLSILKIEKIGKLKLYRIADNKKVKQLSRILK